MKNCGMKHRGEGTFIQTENIGNNNRHRERVQYDNRSVNQLNQNHFNNRYGERVQYDNRSVNQLNQNHFNMAFQQSGTTAYPPSNISSGNHNSNHLHFENNSDQMKTYKDVCDQMKENNYNDFIELEPRDNDLIVQQDMTNNDTNFEVIVAVNHLCRTLHNAVQQNSEKYKELRNLRQE